MHLWPVVDGLAPWPFPFLGVKEGKKKKRGQKQRGPRRRHFLLVSFFFSCYSVTLRSWLIFWLLAAYDLVVQVGVSSVAVCMDYSPPENWASEPDEASLPAWTPKNDARRGNPSNLI